MDGVEVVVIGLSAGLLIFGSGMEALCATLMLTALPVRVMFKLGKVQTR